MRVLICGDRRWKDVDLVCQTLRQMLEHGMPVSTVIEGECRGADRHGKIAAKALGIPVMECPADWEHFGRAAGPVRNRYMLREGKPDLVLAFHDDLDHSKGTKDMVEISREAGVEVRVIKHKSVNN